MPANYRPAQGDEVRCINCQFSFVAKVAYRNWIRLWCEYRTPAVGKNYTCDRADRRDKS